MTARPGGGRVEERGQVSVLVVGFAMVALLLVGVVVDASASFLRRQSLLALADGAALAAADGIAGEAVYTAGLGRQAQLDPQAAAAEVTDYLAATEAAQRYPGLRWTVDVTGTRVTVAVSAPLDLPITPPGWPTGTLVDASATAVVPVN